MIGGVEGDTVGVRSTKVLIKTVLDEAGVGARGAMSPFDGVTVGSGSARTGCEGVVGWPDREGMGLWLPDVDGDSLEPFERPFVLVLMNGAGKRVTLAQGAVSLVIEVAAGLGDVRSGLASVVGVGCMGWVIVGLQGTAFADLVRTGCGRVVGRKSLALGTGPIDSLLSFAQSNCRGSSGVALCVVWSAGAAASRILLWLSSVPS